MRKKALAIAIVAVPFLSGCVPGGYYPSYNYGNNEPRTYSHGNPGYQGSSYGVVRDSQGNVIERHGSVWSNQPQCQPRIGLPGHGASPSPRAIQQKFQQDVARARRH